VEAVASPDEIADEFALHALFPVTDARRSAAIACERDIFDLKKNGPPGIEPRLNQILDQFVLSVDGDGAATGKRGLST